MAFIDRFSPETEPREIGTHEMGAVLSKLATGDWTLAEFKTRLNLNASDNAQLNILINYYNNLPTSEKPGFPELFERELLIWEKGKQTRTEFLAFFGL